MTPPLTDKQENNISNEWDSRKNDPPSLLELIRVAYPDRHNLDGRSKEGRLVKEFLSKKDVRARGAHEYKAKELISLSEEQKEYIRNNVSAMTGLEIGKILFLNDQLTNLHQEIRTINNYIKTLENDENIQTFESESNELVEKYVNPKTSAATINKVIKFVPNSLNKEKIAPKDKRNIKALMGFLSTYRFLHHINNMQTVVDRTLFESSFIRYTYDKWDLTQEEIDQYIVLATEVVISSNISRRIEHLQRMLDDTAADTEGRRISMSLVEAISSRQTEYNQSINRQTKLLESLKLKRSERLKQIGETNISILNLVELWKEEEGRKQLIRLAEARKKVLGTEVEKLSYFSTSSFDSDSNVCMFSSFSKVLI